jgi:outer membrane protein TolC
LAPSLRNARLLAGAALLAGSASAAAEPFDEPVPGRTVESIRQWVLAHNPELQAMSFEAEAAATRPGPAGALPDPMFAIELEDIDRDRPRLAPDEVGQTAYQLRQRFPLWGKLGLAREAAEADAHSVAGSRDAFALAALATAERAYAEYWYTARATEVVDRLLAVVTDLEALARARYSTGLAPMQDSLKAQVERTAMQRDLIELGAMRAESAAMLNAVLGRAPSDPLIDPAGTPELPVAFDYDALLARAGVTHPQARAASDAARAAAIRRDLTYRNRYPDITLGVAPVQRGDRFESWDLMLELEIPLQQGTRRAQEHEARAMEAAAAARAEAVRTELRGEVGARWARWQAAQRQLELVETTLLPQSEANYRAAVASYRVGAVDFTTLLEALRQWRAAELDRHAATRDVLTWAASLRALAGSVE